MFKLITLFYIFAGVFAIPRKLNDLRVLGGDDIKITGAPFMASLRKSGGHSCGATIVAPNAVITAGHCLNPTTPGEVKVGTNNQFRGGTTYEISDYEIHPDYDSANHHNDIGIVFVSKNFVFDGITVNSTTLSTKRPAANEVVKAFGWGLTEPNGSGGTELLRFVNFIVNDQETCQDHYPLLPLSDFCAGEPGRETCKGDSGGPIISSKGADELVGVVSRGDCTKPGIYTDVFAHKEWIDRILARGPKHRS